MAGLIQAQESLAKSGDFEANLRELCERIVPDMDKCSNEDKKDAYAYLDIKVTTTPEGADIKGFLDPSVLMIGQTSGRTEHHRKLHVLISAEIREHKLAGQTLLLA